MSMKLFVGNLSHSVTENDLQDLFAQHGPVVEVNLMLDRMTGKPRGFAFVTMETKEGAEAAGGFTVDLLKDLAKGLVKKQVEEWTGVKL